MQNACNPAPLSAPRRISRAEFVKLTRPPDPAFIQQLNALHSERFNHPITGDTPVLENSAENGASGPPRTSPQYSSLQQNSSDATFSDDDFARKAPSQGDLNEVPRSMVVNVFFSAVTKATLSRHELLAWVNECLHANLTKIEEMSTGAAYCGMTDYLFPGTVPLRKIKWNSRFEVDWIANWRILQGVWKELGVDKPVPVERLMKAKFQENFEFLQWFRKFADANPPAPDHDYDALASRGGEEFPAALPTGGARGAAAPKPAPARVPRATAPPRTTSGSSSSRSSASRLNTSGRPATTATASPGAPPPASNGAEAATAGATSAAVTVLTQQVDQLKEENKMLTEQVESLIQMEEERDFYFAKLRAIEILCEEEGNVIDSEKIKAILYDPTNAEVPPEALAEVVSEETAAAAPVAVPDEKPQPEAAENNAPTVIEESVDDLKKIVPPQDVLGLDDETY